MNKYHVHRPDCKFDLAPLDVCDCIEKNMEDEIITLRKQVAELDIDVAAWTNTAHILESRAEKAKTRIAELEKKLEGMADLAVDEFSRAEKAEAHIVELDRELINIRRSRREAEAALTEARARLAAVWDEGYAQGHYDGGNDATAWSSDNPYRKETGHEE